MSEITIARQMAAIDSAWTIGGAPAMMEEMSERRKLKASSFMLRFGAVMLCVRFLYEMMTGHTLRDVVAHFIIGIFAYGVAILLLLWVEKGNRTNSN